MGYLRNHIRTAVPAYVALLIATIAQLAVPMLINNMINAVTNAVEGIADQEDAEALLINAILLIVVFASLRGIFAFIQTYMAESTSQGLAFDFRNEIFTKIQRLSFSYYDRNQTGQLMVRATDDVERLRLFIAQGLVLTAQAFVLLTVTLLILLALNWRLTMVILPVLPAAVVMYTIFGRVSQPLFRELQIRLSKLNTILQENVAGIKVVKAFAREPFEQERFDRSTDNLFNQSLRIAVTFSFLFPVILLISQIGQSLILYFGGPQILDGALAYGEYQIFSLYLAFVFLPLGQMGFIIALLAQASASAARIFEILDAESDVQNKPDAVELPPIEGRVIFHDVTFKYFSSSDPVLQNVSFTADPGQTVALLGATGSGKTTIINLLPRFYDVVEGSVEIDGHDVRDVTLDSLRSQIGIVLQETNLFSGSIRDNIAFGRSDAAMDEVIAAAKAAAAHDFITEFPEGYDTPVGERGATLSGGQKQRIAIARALLLNPKLLILDDSTSSVDLITESRIQKALDNLMAGRTSFVIAQRITTVLNADLILVLDRGQVVAAGDHADLMEHSAAYVEIYNSQLVDDAVVEEAVTTNNGAASDSLRIEQGGSDDVS